LIITLILLSVVTFMAITFLALSRRERSAVSTVTDTAGARLAADAALANAEAQIMANVLSTTNPFNFTLLVSTNYNNRNGLVGGVSSFTNVSYYDSSGNFLTGDQFLQNLTNLWYSPRPPVFIPNPTNSSLPYDFRFYLDLNRNGRYDTNGWVANVDNNNNSLGPDVFQVGDPEWIGVLERPDAPYGPNNKFIARYAFIAVPVGNTLDLNAIHNQAHWGIAPLPSPGVNPVNPPGDVSDIFIRNEGVGSWEINLAAFLADLNTNKWGQDINQTAKYYQYKYDNQGVPPRAFNLGSAFDDARALLTYRYNNDFKSLSPVGNLFLFGLNGVAAFSSDNIDGYTYGQPLMTGFQLPGENDSTLIDNQVPWAGADNTNHFFTHQELFDSTKIQNPYAAPALGFTDRLQQAGTNNSTYDRYTFYRLLSQLGTDSTPESGKMNLNYDNLDPYTNGIASSTNFMAWTPIAFFTNAADRLLRAYTTQWRNSNPTNFATTFYTVTNFNFDLTDWDNYPAFGITNIPVLVSNQFVYSPAVNRLLQLAANMYDATTNNFGAIFEASVNNYNYPSVFRPTFWVTNVNGYRNVYINGYQFVILNNSAYNPITLDPQLALPINVTALPPGTSTTNVYGIPWIIGAKKGFPNFNEFSMESIVWIKRKLEITRPSIDAQLSDYHTNQMYILAISNVFGIECWNSYNSNYTSSSQIQIVARDRLSMMLTNKEASGLMMSPVTWSNLMFNTVILPLQGAFYTWPGSAPWTLQQNGPSSPNANSFDKPLSADVVLPLNANGVVSTNGISIYVYQNHNFIPAEDPDTTTNYVDVGIVPMPQFVLLTTNRLQVFMLDGNHIIDYVQFAGPDSSRNLNAEIADYDPSNPDIGLWNTNFFGDTTPWGVVNQIYYALNPQQNKKYLTANDDTTWRNPPGGGTVGQEIASLNAFLNANHWGSGTDPNTGNSYSTSNLNLSVQVSFAPPRIAYQYTSWQANDPLVHYVTSDLNYTGAEAGGLQTGTHQVNYAITNLPPNNLGQLNDRYQPWGITLSPAGADPNAFNLAYKDPLVRQSDNWDFPTNKLPGIGWLGRVHRGTPWQTVYLKATNILALANYPATWAKWTGDTNLAYGQYFDADNSAPVQDRLLFDLFTTTFNDNATRGTLSVNQNHLAAWSALFSGVVAITNNAPDNFRMRQVAQYQYPPPSNSWMIIQPAGPAWTNSALGQLVNGINQTRANNNLFPLQGFAHVGDILATPQFTERSPFLNWNDALQQINGISDEMYEWLPQQTMSLLRCADSPRYVIYCYGQALKPAPNGIYTGGDNFFGMVTNYQVVSEIATRAVVRFGSMLTNVVSSANISGNIYWFTAPVVTNNNAVIESFNILPPD
jgi:hypothetical protein